MVRVWLCFYSRKWNGIWVAIFAQIFEDLRNALVSVLLASCNEDPCKLLHLYVIMYTTMRMFNSCYTSRALVSLSFPPTLPLNKMLFSFNFSLPNHKILKQINEIYSLNNLVQYQFLFHRHRNYSNFQPW